MTTKLFLVQSCLTVRCWQVATGPSRSIGSIQWVGLGGRVHIWKPVSLWANIDGGGFDANSDSAFQLQLEGRRTVKEPIAGEDWSYQTQGGLEFQVTRWLWTQLGWRYLKYDYVAAGFTNKTAMNGPFVQGGVNF